MACAAEGESAGAFGTGSGGGEIADGPGSTGSRPPDDAADTMQGPDDGDSTGSAEDDDDDDDDPSGPLLDVGSDTSDGHCGTPPPLQAAEACESAVLGADFEAYECWQLGAVPGLDPTFGYAGLAIAPDAPNTLVVRSYQDPPGLYRVALSRNADCEIIGLADEPASFWWDGELGGFGDIAFSPSSVLAEPQQTNGELVLLPHDGAMPAGVAGPLGVDIQVAGLSFVPAGFPGADTLKVVAGQNGNPSSFDWWSVPIDYAGPGLQLTGSPSEGPALGAYASIVFVSADSPGFSVPSALVIDAGAATAYELDTNGDPSLASARTFLTADFNTGGGTTDPTTGAFLFSSALLGDEVLVVNGFVPLPEG